MTSFRFRLVSSVFFLVSLLCASSWAAEKEPLDRLVLNDAENIRVNLIAASEDVLIITHGRARRAFMAAREGEAGGRVVLDIVGRDITLKTNVSRISISGAKAAWIAGIASPCWGSFEAPALFVDRDCKVTLIGRAARCAVVEVHPLAVAAVDAMRLETKEIVIVGNAGTKVLHKPDTKVSHRNREGVPQARTSGSAESWTVTPELEPATVASPPPQPPTASPQPASGPDRTRNPE